MPARSRFEHRSRARAAALGVTAVIVLMTAGASPALAATPDAPADAAALPVPAPGAAHRGSPSRPDYNCSSGGFCGAEGWEYGLYAHDTKESTGCGPGPDGVDTWDLSASHSPVLPDWAKPYCAFFYGFASCSLPTVICEN